VKGRGIETLANTICMPPRNTKIMQLNISFTAFCAMATK